MLRAIVIALSVSTATAKAINKPALAKACGRIESTRDLSSYEGVASLRRCWWPMVSSAEECVVHIESSLA